LLGFDFEVVKDEKNAVPPTTGIHILGLFLDGCKWDNNKRILAESDPKVLFVEVPMIWLRPCHPS